ncbi:hypothetical protein PINS_up001145 [Pythium insidiosum]|nr:hypothetical protein PINS_up001145 [Pythium insidiosum]
MIQHSRRTSRCADSECQMERSSTRCAWTVSIPSILTMDPEGPSPSAGQAVPKPSFKVPEAAPSEIEFDDDEEDAPPPPLPPGPGLPPPPPPMPPFSRSVWSP